MSYRGKRNKYFEKNKKMIKYYKSLTKEELLIEYADKKARYEFQKLFLIGIIMVFLLALTRGINISYALFLSMLKNLSETGKEIEKAIHGLSLLGILIIAIIIISFIIFICFYVNDIKKEYKDLLILEEWRKL